MRCTYWLWRNNNSRWFRLRRRNFTRWSWLWIYTWLWTSSSRWWFRRWCIQPGIWSSSLWSALLNLIVDRSASRMNKLIRQTERQEVTTPLVSNRSVANDSLLFHLLYLRSFIYISFNTFFYWLIFILHHFISFYNFLTLFLSSSSYVFHTCPSMYRLPHSACVNVQIGVSFCSSMFVVLCNCLFF